MKKNQVKIPAGINAMNVLELLAVVAKSDFPYELVLPDSEIRLGERVHGQITSPLAQRLYTVTKWLDQALIEIRFERTIKRARNQMNPRVDPECAAFSAKLDGLQKRTDLLKKLMWMAAWQDIPAIPWNNVSLRKNWQVVNVADGPCWNATTLFPDADDAMNTLVADILRIAGGTVLPTDDIVIETYRSKEAVRKIGVVTDPLIRSLWALMTTLQDRCDQALSIDGRSLEKIPEAEVLEWLGKGDTPEMSLKVQQYNIVMQAQNILIGLFWRAAQDTMPEMMEIASGGVTLRPGWEIFLAPAEEDACQDDAILLELDMLEMVFGGSLFGPSIFESMDDNPFERPCEKRKRQGR